MKINETDLTTIGPEVKLEGKLEFTGTVREKTEDGLARVSFDDA